MIAKNRDNDDPVDTDIELETNVVKRTELSTYDSVARQFIENLDANVDIEEEMDFYDLTITGNHSDYHILEEEKENISKNDDVWVRTKNDIWIERVLLIPYS